MCHSSSEEEPTEELAEDDGLISSRTRSSIKAPDRYGDDTASEDSDTVCMICNERDPPIVETMVFWIDCDNCGEWAHTYCAFGSNTASRRYLCFSCSS